jgi:hypothetical protein
MSESPRAGRPTLKTPERETQQYPDRDKPFSIPTPHQTVTHNEDTLSQNKKHMNQRCNGLSLESNGGSQIPHHHNYHKIIKASPTFKRANC